jgi:hypothetical protein
MYLEYVQSWTRPKKPDRTSAKMRIPMPDAYVYGLAGDVDDERDSDTERVVIMTPVVTRITDMICVRVYLVNEINIKSQPKNGLLTATNVPSRRNDAYIPFI